MVLKRGVESQTCMVLGQKSFRLGHIAFRCSVNRRLARSTSIPGDSYLIGDCSGIATVGGQLAAVQELPQQASQRIRRYVCVSGSVLRKRDAVDMACNENAGKHE